jgi:hypothetical protein
MRVKASAVIPRKVGITRLTRVRRKRSICPSAPD